MSLEGMPRDSAPPLPANGLEDIDHRIDFILEHHEPLRETWEKKIEGLSPAAQLGLLENLAGKRREMMKRAPYLSNKLKIAKEIPDSAKEFFSDTFDAIASKAQEVDRGYNGKIMEYVDPKHLEPDVVFKVLIRSPIGEQNDLLSEASYLADLHDLSTKNKDLQIGVPQPYYCATLTNARVIAMEKIIGMSIENILEHNLPLPAGLDIDLLESRLLQFVERINAAGFYHNDMRVGNIMLTVEKPDDYAPLAYVVDTGNAKYDRAKHEMEQKIDRTLDYVMVKQAMDTLRRYKSRQKEEQV